MTLNFGKNVPMIAISITGSSLEEVAEQWRSVAAFGPDLVEWRLDGLARGQSVGLADPRVADLGTQMRAEYGIPVLATVRTVDEGGSFGRGHGEYRLALEVAAAWADAVDVELGLPGAARLIDDLGSQSLVVGSFHDFTSRPSLGITQQLLEHMQELGCAVGKVAWMVKDQQDIDLIESMQKWARTNVDIPTVIIGMGKRGTATRLGDFARRSAFTFARGMEASAPGQPDISEVRASL